jgi:capsular exopolysaccharide synthesis family protein
MAGSQLQSHQSRDHAIDALRDDAPPAEWGTGQQSAVAEPTGPSLGRYLAALNRFKWLILLFGVLGGTGGYVASRFIEAEYKVQATILLQQGTGTQGGNGPIQAKELLAASGWKDLLRSYSIADPVVTELALFVTPHTPSDSTLFRSFRVDQPRLRPGDFVLAISGNRYTLTLKPRGEGAVGGQVESGVLGDSIGRPVGFLWQPSARSLVGKQDLGFNVQTPREASIALIGRMNWSLENGSPFLFLTMTGTDAKRTAATLNAWVNEFVAYATALKKKNVGSVARILDGQRAYAAANLARAESELESFRVRTVTEPNEGQTIAPGIEMTNNPVFGSYFRDRLMADSYQRDREALERILATGRQDGSITREAVLSIPLVNGDPAAENLRRALTEQADREVVLRRLSESYTDENQRIIDAKASLASLRTGIIPSAMSTYLSELRRREQSIKATVAQSSKDLRSIPVRTIEEQRLKRQVEASAELYRNLNLKASEAMLAEAATVPDVEVIDAAVAPLLPTKNTALIIILGALAAALALGAGVAILLDQLDKRFRYPEQATNDLGLFVLGVVPVVASAKKRKSVDTAAQVVEAFRTIRMNVRYAADPARPLAFTITSPGPGDGKSLISSNLALSFAESGARTLLIDADIRRGELSKVFGTSSRPGLVEYLEGTALIAEVLHPVSAHPNLSLMPGGARKRRAPELLATARLTQLISQMSAEYDVVIVDSPPLGAGFDAFALATATGNLALVLRSGITDRKMAEAKMAVVDTLPVRVMGTVLNGIKLVGAYEYYSYYQDYAAHDEEPVAQLAKGSGAGVSLTSPRR